MGRATEPQRSGDSLSPTIWQRQCHSAPSGLFKSMARGLGQAYAGVAAFLGLLGGFISGSETSSIVMLTKLHCATVAQVFAGTEPGRLQAIALLVAAVSGIGGGLASVISPAKLQNAAAVIDQIGLEGKVIKATVVIALLMTAAAALMTFVFMQFIP